jgi:deoxyribonuclease V
VSTEDTADAEDAQVAEDAEDKDTQYGVVDVHYPEAGSARAALIVYRDESFATAAQKRVVVLDEVAPYRPGNFYERELPAIRAVLATADPLDLLVVDGYADLDPHGRPGLGARVHAAFGVPVIGVAKSSFRTATHAVPVRRGTSKRPLYVTAAGLPVPAAAALVEGMHGATRIPTALRAVDRLCRTGRVG